MRGLSRVKRSIVIACPKVKPARNSPVMARLVDLAPQGIRIAVLTREANEFTERLQMHGVQIIIKEALTLSCTILDRAVVWYGSVPVLGHHRPNDNIITLHAPELASTLINQLIRN